MLVLESLARSRPCVDLVVVMDVDVDIDGDGDGDMNVAGER